MKQKLLRDTFVEINLDNIKYNINQIRQYIGDDIAIAAVVKANGYGHGAIDIAPAIIEGGGDILAVATLTEGLELRKRYHNYEILIMGYTPDAYLEFAVKNNLVLTIFSLNQANILNKIAKDSSIIPRVHIKYDTGFNRLGYKDSEKSIQEIITIINLKFIQVEGIFSHLALKNRDEDKTQYDKFASALKKIETKSKAFKFKHICDSISTILYPEFYLSMVRLGAIIYGLESEEKGIIDVKPVMTFKTRLSQIKEIEAGEGISYGYRWKAKKRSLIGTIPVGYADGYPRNLYRKGIVTVNGKKAPIIGVICMDQCMIDLTEIKGVKENDEVILFSDGLNNTLSVEEIATLAETNKNDIISGISRRVTRVYMKNSKVFKIRNYLLSND